MAEFDSNKPIQLNGIVTKVEWTNPHVWIYLNVKNDETGETVNWVLNWVHLLVCSAVAGDVTPFLSVRLSTLMASWPGMERHVLMHAALHCKLLVLHQAKHWMQIPVLAVVSSKLRIFR